MVNYLLYISSGLIGIAYICYILMVVANNNKKITESTGFDITKDVLSEYNKINIILSKGIVTYYNIKRGVIKLSKRCYYGNDLSGIAISLSEASLSVMDDNRNKFINIGRKIFSTLKYLYIFPILAIFINFISFGISDAKIGIIVVGFIAIISYMFINVKIMACEWISARIKKVSDISTENKDRILNFINKIILVDKFIFFGELVIIIRFVAIIINFNI